MILFFLPHELWIYFMRICGFYLCFMISWILDVEKQKLILSSFFMLVCHCFHKGRLNLSFSYDTDFLSMNISEIF